MERPKSPDDSLATEYRAETDSGAWPGPHCPSNEALEALLNEEISESERLTVTEHLAGCSGCAGLVRDLKSLEDWAETAAEALATTPASAQSPLPFRPAHQVVSAAKPPIWRAWPAALAASLLLIVGLTSIWTLTTGRTVQTDSPPDVLRSSSQAVSPAPGDKLSTRPSKFTWPAQPGATSYRLTVFNLEGDAIWSSDQTVETEMTVPERLFDSEIAATYSWTVSIEGNVPRNQLGPYSFSVRTSSQ